MRPKTMVRMSAWLSTQRPGCGPDGGETGDFSSDIPRQVPRFAARVFIQRRKNSRNSARYRALAGPAIALRIAATDRDDYAAPNPGSILECRWEQGDATRRPS